jgi:hypothetical protein
MAEDGHGQVAAHRRPYERGLVDPQLVEHADHQVGPALHRRRAGIFLRG